MAAEKNNSMAIVAAGGGGALLTWLLTRNPVGAAGTVTLDEETKAILAALLQEAIVQSGTLAAVEQILNLIASLSGGAGGGYPSNTETFFVGQVEVKIANAAVSIGQLPIVNGMSLVIKAHPDNNGVVRVGPSQANAENALVGWPLMPNEGISYKIKNAMTVWVTSDTAHDVVCWSLEQE